MKLKIGLILVLCCLGCATPEATPKTPTTQPVTPTPSLTEVENKTLLGEQNHLHTLMQSIAALRANMEAGQTQLAGMLILEKTKETLDHEKLGAIAAEQFMLKVYLKALREVEGKLAIRIIEIEERGSK